MKKTILLISIFLISIFLVGSAMADCSYSTLQNNCNTYNEGASQKRDCASGADLMASGDRCTSVSLTDSGQTINGPNGLTITGPATYTGPDNFELGDQGTATVPNLGTLTGPAKYKGPTSIELTTSPAQFKPASGPTITATAEVPLEYNADTRTLKAGDNTLDLTNLPSIYTGVTREGNKWIFSGDGQAGSDVGFEIEAIGPVKFEDQNVIIGDLTIEGALGQNIIVDGNKYTIGDYTFTLADGLTLNKIRFGDNGGLILTINDNDLPEINNKEFSVEKNDGGLKLVFGDYSLAIAHPNSGLTRIIADENSLVVVPSDGKPIKLTMEPSDTALAGKFEWDKDNNALITEGVLNNAIRLSLMESADGDDVISSVVFTGTDNCEGLTCPNRVGLSADGALRALNLPEGAARAFDGANKLVMSYGPAGLSLLHSLAGQDDFEDTFGISLEDLYKSLDIADFATSDIDLDALITKLKAMISENPKITKLISQLQYAQQVSQKGFGDIGGEISSRVNADIFDESGAEVASFRSDFTPDAQALVRYVEGGTDVDVVKGGLNSKQLGFETRVSGVSFHLGADLASSTMTLKDANSRIADGSITGLGENSRLLRLTKVVGSNNQELVLAFVAPPEIPDETTTYIYVTEGGATTVRASQNLMNANFVLNNDDKQITAIIRLDNGNMHISGGFQSGEDGDLDNPFEFVYGDREITVSKKGEFFVEEGDRNGIIIDDYESAKSASLQGIELTPGSPSFDLNLPARTMTETERLVRALADARMAFDNAYILKGGWDSEEVVNKHNAFIEAINELANHYAGEDITDPRERLRVLAKIMGPNLAEDDLETLIDNLAGGRLSIRDIRDAPLLRDSPTATTATQLGRSSSALAGVDLSNLKGMDILGVDAPTLQLFGQDPTSVRTALRIDSDAQLDLPYNELGLLEGVSQMPQMISLPDGSQENRDSLTKGQLLAIMDSDNWWDNGVYQALVNAYRAKQIMTAQAGQPTDYTTLSASTTQTLTVDSVARALGHQFRNPTTNVDAARTFFMANLESEFENSLPSALQRLSDEDRASNSDYIEARKRWENTVEAHVVSTKGFFFEDSSTEVRFIQAIRGVYGGSGNPISVSQDDTRNNLFVRTQFSLADADNNGVISDEEITDWCKKAGYTDGICNAD